MAATLAPGLHVTRHIEEALHGADVLMLLRLQKERLAGKKMRARRLHRPLPDDDAPIEAGRRDAIVMHPGPIIRGLELTAEVADCPQSMIVDEVRNGVPTWMAILARAVGRAKDLRDLLGWDKDQKKWGTIKIQTGMSLITD